MLRNPFAFCPPSSASVFFRKDGFLPARPRPQHCVLRRSAWEVPEMRPTDACYPNTFYEHPHSVGSWFVTPQGVAHRRSRALVAHPAFDPLGPGKLAFHDAGIASAENMAFLFARHLTPRPATRSCL